MLITATLGWRANLTRELALYCMESTLTERLNLAVNERIKSRYDKFDVIALLARENISNLG